MLRSSSFAAAALIMAAPAAAEVVQSSPAGFVSANAVDIAASPDAVWQALLHPERWWESQHSWSGDAANMALEPRAGGCFCESLPGGGSAEHMRVVHLAPSRQLVLRGALGPLQGEALVGTLTVTLAAEGEGTRMSWTYVVGGHARFSLVDVASAVDGVMAAQLARLAAEASGPEDAPAGF